MRPGGRSPGRAGGASPALRKTASPGPPAGPSPVRARAAASAALELTLREATHLYQRQLILARVDACGGDMSKARESLGLPWTTMKRFCDKLGIATRAIRPKAEPAVAD